METALPASSRASPGRHGEAAGSAQGGLVPLPGPAAPASPRVRRRSSLPSCRPPPSGATPRAATMSMASATGSRTMPCWRSIQAAWLSSRSSRSRIAVMSVTGSVCSTGAGGGALRMGLLDRRQAHVPLLVVALEPFEQPPHQQRRHDGHDDESDAADDDAADVDLAVERLRLRSMSLRIVRVTHGALSPPAGRDR